MLRRVALVRNDVSEELTRATRRNIPEDTIHYSHRRENLKSYIICITQQRDRISGPKFSAREVVIDTSVIELCLSEVRVDEAS
jgi:hypothetical protein